MMTMLDYSLAMRERFLAFQQREDEKAKAEQEQMNATLEKNSRYLAALKVHAP